MTAWFERVQVLNVYNNSGEEIPPFACMELDYQFDSGKSANEIDGAEVVFWVKKPTITAQSAPERVVFNGPSAIPDEGFGQATICNLIQGLWDFADTASIGQECGATDAEWFLSGAGSGFKIKSVDRSLAYVDGDIKTLFVETIGGSSIKHAYPPSGGIPAATWDNATETMTPGVASCRIAIRSGGAYSPTEDEILVENPVGAIVGSSGKPITIGKNTSGAWTVLVEDCTGSTATVVEVPANDAVNSGTSGSFDMGYTMGV